jgi:hypothetical protein
VLTPLLSSKDSADGPFLYEHVEELLATLQAISLARQPPPVTPVANVDRHCSPISAIARLQNPQTPVPSSIAQLLSAHLIGKQERLSLRALTAQLQGGQPLSKRARPTSKMAARWANLFAPTCLWMESELLPMAWQGLTVIPTTGTNCSPLTNLWTLPELRNLPAELSHIGLTEGNYSPIAVDNPDIQGLLAALLHHVCEHLLILRRQRQSLPSARPSQYQSQCIQHHLAELEEPTHTPHQRFLDNGDMLGKDLDFSDLVDPRSTKQTPRQSLWCIPHSVGTNHRLTARILSAIVLRS